eukprot:gene16372-18568_t
MSGNFEADFLNHYVEDAPVEEAGEPLPVAPPKVGLDDHSVDRVIKIHSYQQVPVRLDELKLKSIEAFLDYVSSLNAGQIGFEFKVLINPYVLRAINMNRIMDSLGELQDEDFAPAKLEQTRSWLLWSLKEAKDAVSSMSIAPEIKELEGLTLHYEVENPAILQAFMVSFNRLIMVITEDKLIQSRRPQHAIVKKILKNLKEVAKKNRGIQMLRLCDELESGIDQLDTFEKLQKRMLELHKSYWEAVTKSIALGYVSLFNRPDWRKHKDIDQEFHRLKSELHTMRGSDEFVPKRGRYESEPSRWKQPERKNPAFAPTTNAICTGCGRSHKGGAAQCFFKSHPNFNKLGMSWKDSRYGKLWAERGQHKLPRNKAMVNGMEVPWSGGRFEQTPPMKGECFQCSNQSEHDVDNVFIYAKWKLSSMMGIPMKTLLDTGCLKANLVASDFIERSRNVLMAHGVIIHPCQANVCTIHACTEVTEKVTIAFSFRNQITSLNETILINALVVKDLPADLIIGLDSIRNHCLLSKFQSFFEEHPMDEELDSEFVVPREMDLFHSLSEMESPALIQCTPESIALTNVAATTNVEVTMGSIDKVMATRQAIDGTFPFEMDDDDEIVLNPVEDIRELNHRVKGIDAMEDLNCIQVFGSEELQSRLRLLCHEFRHVFSMKLNKEPARIKPLTLEVDEVKWRSRANQGPPRPQSFQKLKDLQRDLRDLLDMGVIQLSKCPYYSQVLLVPKPDNTWRLCIDYRRLNDATMKCSWPLPKISDILSRIGESKSTLFCKMDATKGYYQAPLHESARPFTAFTTTQGIYEWTRVPMGV